MPLPGATSVPSRAPPAMDFSEEGSWSLSFAGAGYLGLYHVGVTQCLREHAPHLLQGARRFYGASSGALSAVAVVCGKSIGACGPRCPGREAGGERAGRTPSGEEGRDPTPSTPSQGRRGGGVQSAPFGWARCPEVTARSSPQSPLNLGTALAPICRGGLLGSGTGRLPKIPGGQQAEGAFESRGRHRDSAGGGPSRPPAGRLAVGEGGSLLSRPPQTSAAPTSWTWSSTWRG